MSHSDMPTGGSDPSEEELRAAYEAEIKKIRVESLLLEQVVTLVNMGMRRTGLAPGTEDERDAGQVRLAIEGVRAVLPLIDQIAPQQAAAVRDALSQLQLAFVRIGGKPMPDAGPPASASAEPGGAAGPAGPVAGDRPPSGPPGGPGGGPSGPGAPPSSGGAGPAQRSGRLWIPGQ